MRLKIGSITILALVWAFSGSALSQTVLNGIDGSRVDVQAQKGRVVVLAIGASWLPLSGKQADITNALTKKYQGRDVVVYFIVTDSANPKSQNFATNETVKKFAFTNKLGVPVLRDADGGLTLHKFNVDQVPSFVILDKNGVMVGEPFGGIDPDPKFDVMVPISKVIDKLLI